MLTKKEQLKEKVIETVKELVTKEGNITFYDLESLFGRSSEFMAALTANLKVSF